MPTRTPAAIVTVGSELLEGLRLDTNTREIAASLAAGGYVAREAVSVGDDVRLLAETLRRLTASYALVVVTGGLGPTHDDITRDAVSRALGLPLAPDAALAERLAAIAARHVRPDAAYQVENQALILEGAQVLAPESGTAPGQVLATPSGRLVLLPGPPHEMRPMLHEVLEGSPVVPPPRIFSCVGLSESDAQMAAQEAIGDLDVSLTVLATPGLVDVVLVDMGAGAQVVDSAADRVRSALGDHCFAEDGRSLAATVLDLMRREGMTLAVAESCTGGMLSTALTDVPGASDVFLGGVVAYANEVKRQLLGVSEATLSGHGAVSGPSAEEMALGVLESLQASLAVSLTGIAGPQGGTSEKPVGLVWFAVADADGVQALQRRLFGDRTGVRTRAAVNALDLVRRHVLGL
ncbi:MAG: CinA family nicotinamide mononucleotide deamidase-related protein [Coriobacteriia bacterium]|nr:CinA family nicotinamide mononucleotide deamidase-related protein [Coriobacteriia bacterium]